MTRPQPSIRFTFDGQTYYGVPGDTLASALLANGVRLVARALSITGPEAFSARAVKSRMHWSPFITKATPNLTSSHHHRAV